MRLNFCLAILFMVSFPLGLLAQENSAMQISTPADSILSLPDSLSFEQQIADSLAYEKYVSDSLAQEQQIADSLAYEKYVSDSLTQEQQIADSLAYEKYVSDSLAYEKYVADSLTMSAHLEDALYASWLRNVKIEAVTDSATLDSLKHLGSDDPISIQLENLLKLADATKARNAYDLSYAQIDYRMPVIAPTSIPRKSRNLSSQSLRRNRRTFGSDMSELGRPFRLQNESAKMRSEAIFNYFIAHPMQVKLCRELMNKAPERSRLSVERTLRGTMLSVPNRSIDFKKPEAESIHPDKWHYKGTNTLQVTQTSLSDNWYKGGENNLSIYSDQKLVVKRYDEEKITTFEATLEFKNSLYYTETDTVHSLRVNDNQMRLDITYGYKAWKKWYYSSSLVFKTPLFNYYAANSKTLKSAFLSPMDLNISVGMDYKYEKKNKVSYSLMLAPLSYNMKYVSNQRVNVTQYGISSNRRVLNQVGASLTSKLEWVISNNVTWSSRLYAFTSYDTFVGEFENTFTLKVNRYMAAKLLLYPRIDDDTNHKPWQFKEMFTLGFDYVW